MLPLRLLAIFAALAVFPAFAGAQSNPSSFAHVINAPPTDVSDLDDVLDSTQLNLFSGSETDRRFMSGDLRQNVEVNILGGALGHQPFVQRGVMVNLIDGRMGGSSYISGTLNASGGEFGTFRALGDAVITASGGLPPDFAFLKDQADYRLVGGEFRLDRLPVAAGPTAVPAGGVLTGTLADGTVFITRVGGWDGSNYSLAVGAAVNLIDAPLPAIGPGVEVFDDTTGPLRGVRPGQWVEARAGVQTPRRLNAVGGRLDVAGGVLPVLFTLDTDVNAASGAIERLTAGAGSRVELDGASLGGEHSDLDGVSIEADARLIVQSGSVGRNLHSRERSHVSILGGQVGSDWVLLDQSQGWIAGGDVGAVGTSYRFGRTVLEDESALLISGGEAHDIAAFDHGQVSVTGGEVGTISTASSQPVRWAGGQVESIEAAHGTSLHLYVADITLNGAPLSSLGVGDEVTLAPSDYWDASLAGTFVNGDAFSFEINAYFSRAPVPFIFTGASELVVTLLSSAAFPGDYNANGQVEQGDLDLVLQNWGIDTDLVGVPFGWFSDRDGLGQIEQAELDRVLTNWGSTGAPNFRGTYLPEPTALPVLALAALLHRRARGCTPSPRTA